MIDRHSLTDHPSLSGIDYVLEGASIRDRFLTAFVLQHNGSLEATWPRATSVPDRPDPSSPDALFPGVEEERFSIQAERACEPLTLLVVDEWLGADDDEGDL